MATPLLIVIGKNNERAVISLEADRTSIGRGPDNTLPLTDEKLSRHHCVIRRKEDSEEIEIEDLKSLNGTRLNGRLIRRRTPIGVGDTVVIGNTTLIIESEDSPLLDTQAIQSVDETVASGPGNIESIVGQETEVPGMATAHARAGHGTLAAASDSQPLGDDVQDRLRRENAFLRRLLEINTQINSDLKSQRVLTSIVDAAIELTAAERGFLLMKPDDLKRGEKVQPDDLKVTVARNLDKERIVSPKLSSTILEKVVNDGRSMIVADAQHRGELSEARSIRDLSIQSVLAVPLRVQDEVLGALYLDHRWRQEAFSGATIELVEAFASQAALALYNARLIGEVEEKAAELESVNARIQQLNEELEARMEQQTAELTAVRSRLELVGDETQQTAMKFTEIIGNSPALMRVLKTLDKVADTDLPVYIHGESGTGKELIAKALHRYSRRSEERFVAVNCAEFTDTLLASELYGHVKGAFTGADKDKKGLFEEADGGTLFLDEIGDMSPGMQTQLLRVLAEGEFRRVGDSQGVRKVDVRIVSASNKDLQDLIESDEFRQDLFYRLHNARLELPPLRDRREDIPLLITHFMHKICNKPVPPITPQPEVDRQVMRALINYDWPGNIRELENELQLMVVMREGDQITMDQVNEKLLAKPRGPELDELGRTTLKAMVESLEKTVIEKALKKFGFNKSKVAEKLGLSRLGLRKKMERFGIAGSADEE